MGVYKKSTAHFRSIIGGNLHLRFPNKMKFSKDGLLKTAVGKMLIPFIRLKKRLPQLFHQRL